MAIIQNDILKFEIKNITSLYTEFSNMNNESDIGTHEAFDCKIQIGDSIILDKNLELCSGNIQELLKGMNNMLADKLHYTEVEFLEPDLKFNIRRLSSDNFLFQIWCYCSVISDKSNKANAIGLQCELSRNELLEFRDGLRQEWDNKKCKL